MADAKTTTFCLMALVSTAICFDHLGLSANHDSSAHNAIGPLLQQAYLKASNTGAIDWFGAAVAISGDTAVSERTTRTAMLPASTATRITRICKAQARRMSSFAPVEFGPNRPTLSRPLGGSDSSSVTRWLFPATRL